jgi:hypothetical protein
MKKKQFPSPGTGKTLNLKVNVEEPTHGFPAASSTSFNNIKKLNSAVHTTSNSMKENHKSVAILASTLPSSNISINETK